MKYPKKSKALKKRMRAIPKEELSVQMSKIAHVKWSKLSVEQRHDHAMKMVAGRKKI